jgi:hypothetical protein
LIQVKARMVLGRHYFTVLTGENAMPADSLFVSVAVVAIFVVFAAVLFWGDRQTRPAQLAARSGARRRAF